MKRREKIILVVMVLTILGGGYDFFFNSNSSKSFRAFRKEKKDLNLFATDVIAKLNKKGLLKDEKYIIVRAESKWRKDLFIQSAIKLTPEMEDRADKKDFHMVSFVYSGYLNMGNHNMAVINGMEYEAGENLEQDGYFLKNISPARVVIGKKGEEDIVVSLENTD